MLKHVVVWNVKEPKAENIGILKETFLGMKGNIPAVLDVIVGETVDSPYSSRDFVLMTSHENYAKLEEYQKHPYHQGVLARVVPLLQDKASIDFIE